MVVLWSALHTLRLRGLSGHPGGPDSEETLEMQLQQLQKARIAQPLLRTVSFKADVVWTADDRGHWTAIYTATDKTKKVLFSPLDYIPADRVILPSEGKSRDSR